MERRRLGRTGLPVGAIGLGTEHLECTATNMDQVLGLLVEAGGNYVDVIWGDPERNAAYWDPLGAAIRARRDALTLTVHWGPSDMYTPEQCAAWFPQVMARLGNGYADVAMLTVVDTEQAWNDWSQRSLDLLLPYKESGQIGHIGLSGHNMAIAAEAVRSGVIDVCMVPVNLLGGEDPGLQALYGLCAERDVGLVAMKAYHGGTLLHAKGAPTGVTPTQCLAYVLDQPVATVVPGARTAEEMRATLRYLTSTPAERAYEGIAKELETILAGVCVLCEHCLPCPEGLAIPWLIWLLDQAVDGVTDPLRQWYAGHEVKADACTGCGICLERCPYHVEIIEKLAETATLFA